MKDINNIEDWYKNELNDYNVEPDNSVWDSLSENLDKTAPLTDENFNEWYKKEVTKLEERPDFRVWEKLSTRLDTASVWDKLVVSLNRYDQYIWWRNLAFRGTALFLLFFGSYLAYDNYTNNENNFAENSSNNTTINVTANNVNTNSGFNENATNNENSSNKSENSMLNDENDVNKTTSSNAVIANNNSTNNNLSSEDKINNAVASAKKNLIANNSAKNNGNGMYASKEKILSFNSISEVNLNSLKTNDKEPKIFTDIDRHQLSERDISHLYASGEFLVKKDKNKIVFNSKRFSSYFSFGMYARRVYVGFNAGIKKQGMITKVKKNSALAEYKQSNFLDFGSNFGGTVGFIVSDKFNLESNININSTSGYKRGYDAEGVSYQESLNLNYTSINILAKKMNNKSTFDNKVYSTNIIGGIYASYLRSAVSDINGVKTDVDSFNNTDFGIVLGIEQDRYLTKTLVITPGVRYNQGLSNTASNNSNFEASRNFSFEFNLGVKYIFLKKGK